MDLGNVDDYAIKERWRNYYFLNYLMNFLHTI